MKTSKKYYRPISEVKAIEKKTSKEVTDLQSPTKGYDYKDDKMLNNVAGEQFRQGYYTELTDEVNSDKTKQELIDLVIKNMSKNPQYYTEEAQFGIKGIGYTEDAPALGRGNEIKDNALNSIAPSLIHQESDIIKRTLRDMYDEDTNSIIIEGNEGYKKAQNFMKLIMPSHVKKIKKYREKVPLFFKENIEEKLNQIYDSEIKLKSGGYLVINPTEALVSIDINSGSSIKQKNVESTALDTNLEAAEEISRQIKIRDLSGLIIIDFIDMLSFGNRRLVERRLKEQCRTDRARIQIGRISTFGLLEMSRQRLRESAVKWKVTLTDESFAMKILKLVEVKAVLTKAKFVELKICEKISDFMKENFIEDLKYFEEKNLIKIDIIADNTLIIPEYIIDLQNKTKKTIETVQHIEKLKNLEEQKKEVKSFESPIKKKPYKKKPFFKKKFFKKPAA